MLPRESGHYVSLRADGPGPVLWHVDDGSWSAAVDMRQLFASVNDAIETPIKGLPIGYHTKVVFETVPVPAQQTVPSCCCCDPID